MTDQEIIDGVVKEFAGLAKCPRPSKHEQKVSDYLVKRLHELGVTDVVQDEVYNVIANVPATKGYEQAPRVAIQGHMDMVCVAKPGVDYDPLTSEIKLVREGNLLRAEGTSLGADDGVAEAMAFFLLQQDIEHGPLRLIFTVDEETGMSGAIHLDPKYLQDVAYILNCDSEYIDILCVSSAGSTHTYFHRHVKWQQPVGTTAVNVIAKDFLGGHSGETINAGKSNAIKALGNLLLRLLQSGIEFRIATIDGGVAANAIPSKATATIVCNDVDMKTVEDVLAKTKSEFTLVYGDVETSAQFVVEPAPIPAKNMSYEDTKAIIYLISQLHCGVFAMNQELPKLPDLSANIGTLRTEGDVVTLQYFPRSSSDAQLRELVLTFPALAELTGFTVDIATPEPAWTKNHHSKLVPIVADAYTDVVGHQPRIEAMHGGLETGYFYAKNPKLDIVSVGPTTHDIHSADESLELDTVATLVRVLAETLPKLK